MNEDNNYADLMDALDTEAVDLTFVKKNGEQRKMICTRNFPLLSSCPGDFDYVPPKGVGGPLLGGGRVRVWDLEESDWRVVNTKTVLKWKVVPGLLKVGD